MNYRHPWQLKKSKSCEPFWRYQLNSTVNLANFFNYHGCKDFPAFRVALERPESLYMNAFFYIKFIAAFTPTFFGYIISILAIVEGEFKNWDLSNALLRNLYSLAIIDAVIITEGFPFFLCMIFSL